MLICNIKLKGTNLMFDSGNGDDAVYIWYIYIWCCSWRLFGRKPKIDGLTVCLCPLSASCPQKLLVGDFPHELEVDEMEEDVPKRKNRTKARVGCHRGSISHKNVYTLSCDGRFNTTIPDVDLKMSRTWRVDLNVPFELWNKRHISLKKLQWRPQNTEDVFINLGFW